MSNLASHPRLSKKKKTVTYVTRKRAINVTTLKKGCSRTKAYSLDKDTDTISKVERGHIEHQDRFNTNNDVMFEDLTAIDSEAIVHSVDQRRKTKASIFFYIFQHQITAKLVSDQYAQRLVDNGRTLYGRPA